MKHASALLLSLLALSLAGARALPEARPPQEQGHVEEETELARHMETIEEVVKRLRKGLKDEALRADAFQALTEIEGLTLSCKALAPAAAARLPAAERADFLKAYHHAMIDFLRRQLDLEAALLDGDAEGIKLAFDRFREMEDSSHERFAPEDD